MKHCKFLHLLYDNIRLFSTTSSTKQFCFAKLCQRSLLSLKGHETDLFLQGLVTNDVVAHSKNTAENSCLYSFMLNTQGRVLYDLIVYFLPQNEEDECREILLECDQALIDDLKKTLLMYRLRKKIDINKMDQVLDVYSIFWDGDDRRLQDVQYGNCGNDFKLRVNSDHEVSLTTKVKGLMNYFIDPRTKSLGLRAILSRHAFIAQVFDGIEERDEERYHRQRYSLGIGEGRLDLPPGTCLPLESNGDYLNGISFHKGCYVGQELTARTHHTGVVRKRLMPLFFDASLDKHKKISLDSKILDDRRQSVGKFRNQSLGVGLGLLRIEEAMKSKSLFVSNDSNTEVFECSTRKPHWWLNKSPEHSGQVHANPQNL
uniref:Transferase CAF17 homolog, mitochondrial n=1 Tax=Romanomermis culicivorax TaxID=13658 RepID=A0A915JUG1_ROMCU